MFVKSPSDSNDISQFVEKVVFNLHDSFPKPKRIIKDPPFAVKGESRESARATRGSCCLCFLYVFLASGVVELLCGMDGLGIFCGNCGMD